MFTTLRRWRRSAFDTPASDVPPAIINRPIISNTPELFSDSLALGFDVAAGAVGDRESDPAVAASAKFSVYDFNHGDGVSPLFLLEDGRVAIAAIQPKGVG